MAQLKESIRELSAIANVENEPLKFEKVAVEGIFEKVKVSINLPDNQVKLNLTVDFQVREIRIPIKYLRSILLNLLDIEVENQLGKGSCFKVYISEEAELDAG